MSQIQSLSDHEFSQFQRFIFDAAGITMSESKKALVSGRLAKRVQQCQRSLVGAQRLLVSIDLLGHCAGSLVIRYRFWQQPGMLIMRRNLPGDGIRRTTVSHFQRLGYPSVQESSAQGAQRRVCSSLSLS